MLSMHRPQWTKHNDDTMLIETNSPTCNISSSLIISTAFMCSCMCSSMRATLRMTKTLMTPAVFASNTATTSKLIHLVAAAAFFAVCWALTWFMLTATVKTLTVLTWLPCWLGCHQILTRKWHQWWLMKSRQALACCHELPQRHDRSWWLCPIFKCESLPPLFVCQDNRT